MKQSITSELVTDQVSQSNLKKLNNIASEIKSYQKVLSEIISGYHGSAKVIAKRFKQDYAQKIREIDRLRFSLLQKQKSDTTHYERFLRNYRNLKNCYEQFVTDLV